MLRGPGKAKEKSISKDKSTKESGSKVDPDLSTTVPEQKQDAVVKNETNGQTMAAINSANTTTTATLTGNTLTGTHATAATNTNTNTNTTTPQSRNYGTVLHGYLKTRYIDINNNNKKSIFALKSSWKLRYWRLSLTDEGLVFEKSRRPDTRPYKGILLPFGKTSVWENWGKRGDSRYSFGFTLRVTSMNMQMEAAVDSETIRARWLNVLQSAFSSNVQDTGEIVKYLAQKASHRLSKMTDAGDEHCAKSRSLMNLQASKYSSGSEASASWNDAKPNAEHALANINPNQINAFLATDTISVRAPTYTRTETNKSGRNISSVEEFDWKMFDDHVPHDNFIPRRYNTDLYDNEGYMSDHMDVMRAFRSEHEAESIDSNAGKGKPIKRSETSPHIHVDSGKKFQKTLSLQNSVGSQGSGEMVPSDFRPSLELDANIKSHGVDNFVSANHITALSILDENGVNGQTNNEDMESEEVPVSPITSQQKQSDNAIISEHNVGGKQPEMPTQKSG